MAAIDRAPTVSVDTTTHREKTTGPEKKTEAEKNTNVSTPEVPESEISSEPNAPDRITTPEPKVQIDSSHQLEKEVVPLERYWQPDEGVETIRQKIRAQGSKNGKGEFTLEEIRDPASIRPERILAVSRPEILKAAEKHRKEIEALESKQLNEGITKEKQTRIEDHKTKAAFFDKFDAAYPGKIKALKERFLGKETSKKFVEFIGIASIPLMFVGFMPNWLLHPFSHNSDAGAAPDASTAPATGLSTKKAGANALAASSGNSSPMSSSPMSPMAESPVGNPTTAGTGGVDPAVFAQMSPKQQSLISGRPSSPMPVAMGGGMYGAPGAY
jgi:hypothetical protein